MSDRLSDLLEQRAREGTGVRPSLDGVHAAIGARAARRKRQRVAGTALAGLCVAAGIAGGIALAGGDDDAAPIGPADPSGLPEVPLVGLEVEGFAHVEAQTGDLVLDDEPARTVVVFRSGESLADPFVTVAVRQPIDGAPPEVRGSRIDLDGDGVDDAGIGGNDAGMGIEWRLDDGSVASVGAELVDAESEEELITYASQVFGPTLDLRDLPSPPGLPERDTWTVPDPRGPDEARVTYEADDGSERWITVATTNQPGWFDLLQDGSANPADGFGFEEVELGTSFLGPGRAIVFDEYFGQGRDYALVRTDAGLTLEISTGCRSGQACTQPALDAETIGDVIRSGAFVDAGTSSAPTTTTEVVPATTLPTGADSTGVAGSGTVDGPVTLIDLRVERVDESRARVVMEFDVGIPTWAVTVGSSQQPGDEGSCALAQPAADTWLNVVLGDPGGGRVQGARLGAGAFDDLDDPNPTFSGITATLTCEPFEGAARVDVSLPDPIPRPTTVQAAEDPDGNQLVILVDL